MRGARRDEVFEEEESERVCKVIQHAHATLTGAADIETHRAFRQAVLRSSEVEGGVKRR